MKRYEYPEETRILLERSLIPFAIYQLIDKRVVTLILSDGFCKLFNYGDDRKRAYYDMDHNMYKETHPDDAARIADAAFKFATEGGKYEVIYRTKAPGREDYMIIHAIGEHFITDTGVQLAQVWYTDEGLYTDNENVDDFDFNMSLNIALHRESLLKASYYDYLTSLPSMTYFFELAQAGCKTMMKKGINPVFLFMDLSGMKHFNHKHGFAEGDNLLRSFAKLLINYFSNENCSRFGEDHFAIFTDDGNIEETLHELIREWQSTNNNKSLPVRIGVFTKYTKNMDISVACARAKLACDALSNSYVSGINYFDKALLEDVDHKQYIISNLNKAIAGNWITVYYQPIVRALNGRVCDEEALARWIDPIKGFLSPADFIPVLEEAGLIHKLDLYVLDQVLAKIKRMEEAGFNLVSQSINLSRSDFDSCDIVGEICKRVDRAGISHSLINIEITESIVASDFDFMKKQIDRFRKQGFQVWMDDFGSGYSSLDVLQSLNFDLIKFDMSFMQQIDSSTNSRVILTELMKMATALGISTVCEGVEKESHITFLKEIGCSKFQGYYYQKPIPLEKILEKYEKGIQIGFENPDESDYYNAIGRINLYDLDVITSEGANTLQQYFNNVPIAIMELPGESIRICRSNQSYRDFMIRSFGIEPNNEYIELSAFDHNTGEAFIRAIATCAQNETKCFIDEELPNNTSVHAFIRKITTNPVTGTVAVAVAVLAISEL